MNNGLNRTTLWIACAAVCFLAACAAPKPESNADMVMKMTALLSEGKTEESLAYFAEDATGYILGLPMTGVEVYRGKEAIRGLWADSVANHFAWEVEIVNQEENIVIAKTKTWHDFTRQIGVAPLEYLDVYEFQDGKIITYSSVITEDALARFKPAFAEVVPPEPAAEIDPAAAVSELTITLANGTCTTDAPLVLKAGEVKVTFVVEDQDNAVYALTGFALDSDKDMLDLMASTIGDPPSWGDFLLMRELKPGGTATDNFTAGTKAVYFVCWSKPPDLAIGNAGPFQVVP